MDESNGLAWFDGRRVALQRFGTSDRKLYGFPPAGGKNVTLREWRVMLLGVTPGRHTLRYRWRDATGATDAEWIIHGDAIDGLPRLRERP